MAAAGSAIVIVNRGRYRYNWLPGQGGFLDRFDSLVFAGFFLWVAYGLELIFPAS